LVEETKALIEQVESGDTAHAAWLAIRDRVKQLYAGRGRSQAEIGELLGKKPTWVNTLLRWDASVDSLPFSRPERDREPARRERAAKQILAEQPEALAPEIAAAVEHLPEEAVGKIEAAVHKRRRKEYGLDEPGAVPETPPVKPLPPILREFQKVSFALWNLQERAQDEPVDPAEEEQFKVLIEADRKFLDAFEQAVLGQTEFDASVADMLAEARERF